MPPCLVSWNTGTCHHQLCREVTVKLSRDLSGVGFVYRNWGMSSCSTDLYRNHGFPPEIISHTVW